MDIINTVGNANLISSEEERIAEFLKERNLSKVNKISENVTPVDSFYVRHGKRILDLLISVPVFILLLPFNLIFGVCTYFDVGRPIFYKQTRIGKNMRPFIMVKFRNMNNKTDSDGRLLPAKERVTKFGYFMRKYSFDELLNFWSILKGDMSIIGPRPLPVFYVERMSDRHKMRHSVKPGLECPFFTPKDNIYNAYQLKFENDINYVESVSFEKDIQMLLKLVKLVFDKKTRGDHAGGKSQTKSLTNFMGYDDGGYAIGLHEARVIYYKYHN